MSDIPKSTKKYNNMTDKIIYTQSRRKIQLRDVISNSYITIDRYPDKLFFVPQQNVQEECQESDDWFFDKDGDTVVIIQMNDGTMSFFSWNTEVYIVDVTITVA